MTKTQASTDDRRERPQLEGGVVAPQIAELVPVIPGLWWTRLPLPYEPFHVNVYVLEDRDGFAVVDTGLDNEECRAAWITLLAGPLASRPINRIVVTHWHNDHLGLAGWLAARTGARIAMSLGEFSRGMLQSHKPTGASENRERRHLQLHGTPPAAAESWLEKGYRNISRISELPSQFDALDELTPFIVGARTFQVLTVKGHSLSGAALYCAEENFLLCGDHLSPHIVPNISVMSDAPDSNPHADYIASIPALIRSVPDDALILPGHEYPFTGLASTIDRIADHHTKLCNRILAAAQGEPLSAAQLIPAILRNTPNDAWLGFIVGRVVAYAHFLVCLGRLRMIQSGTEIRFSAVGHDDVSGVDLGRLQAPLASLSPVQPS